MTSNPIARIACLLTVILADIFIVSQAFAAPAQKVHPIVECATSNPDGTFTARFGYDSDFTEPVELRGPHNQFRPGAGDRGQPTIFEPGRHANVFTVTFPTNNGIWILDGDNARGVPGKNLPVCFTSTLTGIAVTPLSATVQQGQTQPFRAMATYANATTSDVTNLAVWSSTSTSTATIDADGIASAVNSGATTIRATYQSFIATATLAVTPPFTLTELTVTPASKSIAEGRSLQLTATARYSNGTTSDVTAQALWSTSNALVASVDAQGMASSNTEGTATLTAAFAGRTGTAWLTVYGTGLLPPDPSTVAPSLDTTVSTNFADQTHFLIEGPTPIQTGVAPGTIVDRRSAVLRGTVRTRDGEPLPGVHVGVLGHPELGSTLTRADGRYDVLVNGGGRLTLVFEKGGFLPVHRQSPAPWQEFTDVPAVVMIPPDGVVTTIQSSGATFQTARGSTVADSDGTRRATLLFEPGTAASLRLQDGTLVPVPALHVRATEYTIGATGPEAMPAGLPAQSGYTYCLELSADEAIAAGATVQFSKPVAFYLENFLGFPVGGAVPAGFYDRNRGEWVPSLNGRIVSILSIVSGRAYLDITGDGLADDTTVIGITDAERDRLATLYGEGQQLWRVPMTHFTPWDCNWPFGPPSDAVAPGSVPILPPKIDWSCDECPHKRYGSIIQVENQTLGEVVPVTGTPFALSYSSDRQTGHRAGRAIEIALTPSSVLPASLTRIEVTIVVAGRTFSQSYAPGPGLSYHFVWDGKDGYGRDVPGSSPANISIGYVYPAIYQEPAAFAQSFARLSGVPIAGGRGTTETTLYQHHQLTVWAGDARGAGFGGWLLDVQKEYDLNDRTLHVAGARRSADFTGGIIERAAGVYYPWSGTGDPGSTDEGVLATSARLVTPFAVVAAPDGGFYLAEVSSCVVRRVSPDGIITTVAGTRGSCGSSGDGGPATSAMLDPPTGLALDSRGTLYIAGYTRIRRITPDGIISLVAGTGVAGSTGNGGPALLAQITAEKIAIAPDDTLYITNGSYGIRHIGADGIITLIMPRNSGASPQGDGGPAWAASSKDLLDIAAGPDGSIFFTDRNRIRRIAPNGIVTTIAGGGTATGDGIPSLGAHLDTYYGIAADRDGSVLFSDGYLIRRAGPEGVLTTIGGDGTSFTGAPTQDVTGDGGLATAAPVNFNYGMAIGPDSAVYFADGNRGPVRRIKPSYPAFGGDLSFLIPSVDGSEIYVFNREGRHLRTLDALTNTALWELSYDMGGLLSQVTDRDGLATLIERDSAGKPTAIVAPGGQRTTLMVGGDGYLARIADPAGNAHELTYAGGGLLASMRDRRGNLYTFQYGPTGLLERDADPAGGFKALSRVGDDKDFTVSLSTATGRLSQYRLAKLASGDLLRETVAPTGLLTSSTEGKNGTNVVTNPDGTIVSMTERPDPRFGMRAPFTGSSTVTLPSGLTATTTQARSVTLADPNDPLTVTAATTTFTLNGKTWNSSWNTSLRQATGSTPLGRSITQYFDQAMRPTRLEVPGLTPTEMAYDFRGRVTTMTQGTRTWQFGYDPLDRVISATDPLLRTVQFEYDSADRITKQILPDLREIHFTYDENGNVTSVTPPGRPSHGFTHTPVDLEEQYAPPQVSNGGVTGYEYNADRQLTQVNRPGGDSITLGYDQAGRLGTITSSSGAYTYSYDSTSGNLTAIAAPDQGSIAYSYDGSLPVSATWNGTLTGSITWTYDTNFRLIGENVNQISPVTFTYDNDGLLTGAGTMSLARDTQNGRITGTTLGNITDAYSYDSFGAPAGYVANYAGSPLFSEQYTRDSVGRITQKTVVAEGQTTTYAYTYDAAGRLTDVTTNGTPTAHYDYDANSNRVAKVTPSGTETASCDDQDRIVAYAGGSYSYRPNGELDSRTDGSGATNYSYDSLGNLTRVVLPSGAQIDYVIDAQNRRVGRKLNGTLERQWLYADQLRPVAELNGNGVVISRFLYASRANVPDFVVKGSTTYRVLSDQLGSPRLITDAATGAVVQRLEYDEFGNVLADSNTGFQPFGFAGGLYDRDTGLVRFGARDYDPHTGRWMAQDPIGFAGGDTNLYAYAMTDPVNLVDTDGFETGKLPGTNVPYRIDWNQEPNPNMHVKWPNGKETIINHKGGWEVTHGAKRKLVKAPVRYRKALRKVAKKFVKKAAKMVPYAGTVCLIADVAEAAEVAQQEESDWTDLLNVLLPYKDVMELMLMEEGETGRGAGW